MIFMTDNFSMDERDMSVRVIVGPLIQSSGVVITRWDFIYKARFVD